MSREQTMKKHMKVCSKCQITFVTDLPDKQLCNDCEKTNEN